MIMEKTTAAKRERGIKIKKEQKELVHVEGPKRSFTADMA